MRSDSQILLRQDSTLSHLILTLSLSCLLITDLFMVLASHILKKPLKILVTTQRCKWCHQTSFLLNCKKREIWWVFKNFSNAYLLWLERQTLKMHCLSISALRTMLKKCLDLKRSRTMKKLERAKKRRMKSQRPLLMRRANKGYNVILPKRSRLKFSISLSE